MLRMFASFEITISARNDTNLPQAQTTTTMTSANMKYVLSFRIACWNKSLIAQYGETQFIFLSFVLLQLIQLRSTKTIRKSFYYYNCLRYVAL